MHGHALTRAGRPGTPASTGSLAEPAFRSVA